MDCCPHPRCVCTRVIHVGRGFIIASLFGAYPLLGACLLTTYAHKRIRLLTGKLIMVHCNYSTMYLACFWGSGAINSNLQGSIVGNVHCNYSTMHLACFGGGAPTSKVALLAAQTYV